MNEINNTEQSPMIGLKERLKEIVTNTLRLAGNMHAADPEAPDTFILSQRDLEGLISHAAELGSEQQTARIKELEHSRDFEIAVAYDSGAKVNEEKIERLRQQLAEVKRETGIPVDADLLDNRQHVLCYLYACGRQAKYISELERQLGEAILLAQQQAERIKALEEIERQWDMHSLVDLSETNERLRQNIEQLKGRELLLDALVKKLVQLFDWSDPSPLHALMHVGNAVKNLRADLVVVQSQLAQARREWISVEERLPDRYGEYLVFSRKDGVLMDHWKYNYGLYTDGWYQCGEVTHWMPLPDAPAQAGQDQEEAK